MKTRVRIVADRGVVVSVETGTDVGHLAVHRWNGWPLRAYSFRAWLYELKDRGATFRLNGRHLKVSRLGLFKGIRQYVRCGCGCDRSIRYGVRYTPNHGPPYFLGGHKSRLPGAHPSRFKKGHVPPNKGRKGWNPPGSEKGWFKKGHRPKSWKGGVAHSDGYLYAIVADPEDRYPSGGRRRVNVARVTAERVLGRPLRKDEVVLHLDGDRANNEPDNLRAVTRAESVRIHRRKLLEGRTYRPGTCPRCGTAKPITQTGEPCSGCGKVASGYIKGAP